MNPFYISTSYSGKEPAMPNEPTEDTTTTNVSGSESNGGKPSIIGIVRRCVERGWTGEMTFVLVRADYPSTGFAQVRDHMRNERDRI